MFQNLRSGSPFYILYKTDPRLSIGEVKSVSIPVPQYGTTYQGGVLTPPKNTVDIIVSVDGEDLTLQKIPADMSIADFNTGMVVAENKELIQTEIDSLGQKSEKIISDIPTHQHIVEECKRMSAMLNPHIAKEAEQERRIESLAGEIADIKTMLSEILKQGSNEK